MTSDDPQPDATTIPAIAHSLAALLELPERSAAIQQEVGRLASAHRGLPEAINELRRELAEQRQGMQRLFEQQQASLESLTRLEDAQKQRWYEEQVLEPVVNCGFALWDLIEDRYRHQAEDEAQRRFLRGLLVQLKRWLAEYDIEPVWTRIGSPIDRTAMQIVSWESDRSEGQAVVARNCRAGFKRGQRLLRPEVVAAIRLEPNDSEAATTVS